LAAGAAAAGAAAAGAGAAAAGAGVAASSSDPQAKANNPTKEIKANNPITLVRMLVELCMFLNIDFLLYKYKHKFINLCCFAKI
jgi:hypothetical protein